MYAMVDYMRLLFYNLLILIFLPFMLARILIKSTQDRDYRLNLTQRLGCLSYDGPEGLIWFHAVSLGEVISSEKLVQSYINIASAGGKVKVIGPKNRINFIHAFDVVNAALKAYKSSAWGVFNISSDTSNSILEIAEIAVSISEKGTIDIVDNIDNNCFERFDLDSKLAKKDLLKLLYKNVKWHTSQCLWILMKKVRWPKDNCTIWKNMPVNWALC